MNQTRNSHHSSIREGLSKNSKSLSRNVPSVLKGAKSALSRLNMTEISKVSHHHHISGNPNQSTAMSEYIDQ